MKRFWEKVKKTPDCWEWTAARDGKLIIGSRRDDSRRYIQAHRFSWELAVGPIPSGLLVLHRCDNRKCVNPEHLFLGTAKDNTHDMLRKGRGKLGGRSITNWRAT